MSSGGFLKKSLLFISLLFSQTSLAQGSNSGLCVGKGTNTGGALIRYTYEKGEITALCQQALQKATARLNEITQVPREQRNFDNTMKLFDTILADLSDETTPFVFMYYVSTDSGLREEGANCETSLSQFKTDTFSRREIYNVLKNIKSRDPSEERLTSETLKVFIKSGMNLTDEKLVQVRELNKKINELQTQFEENLNNDTSSIEFTKEELTGVSADFLSRLEKTPNGKLKVTTKGPDYVEVMGNAQKSETRKRMQSLYENRQAEVNTKILEEAVGLRAQVARLMGYKTWADLQLDGRMARDVKTVMSFLEDLKKKLSIRNQQDLGKFLKFKKELDPTATQLNSWDLRFLDEQLKKRDYSLDQEKIREFFPAEVVIKGLFEVYSKLLGVQFIPVQNPSVWNSDVRLFEIRNNKSCDLRAYFFADLVPRKGKYNHAAAFQLISHRLLNGQKVLPVASIVANLNPPSEGKPSLLSHDEVETLFHEFGHIMHQTLSLVPYASLSGSAVAQDFVEAPSQMLENWVWDTQILSSLSGHYKDHSKKLPPEILKQMIAARDFDQGYSYTRQLLLALFDMSIHSQSGSVDVTKIYRDMYKEIVGVDYLEGGHFPASFGHMMGGYDAGYYGYLWSEVYAADMFTKFKSARGKLLDREVGNRYKKTILEKGGIQEPFDLLKSFLGREPNSKAFFERLNLKP